MHIHVSSFSDTSLSWTLSSSQTRWPTGWLCATSCSTLCPRGIRCWSSGGRGCGSFSKRSRCSNSSPPKHSRLAVVCVCVCVFVCVCVCVSQYIVHSLKHMHGERLRNVNYTYIPFLLYTVHVYVRCLTLFTSICLFFIFMLHVFPVLCCRLLTG